MQCTIKLIHINSITLQIVNTMLQIENLEFSYHKKGNPIFNGINLTIQPGSVYGLLGKNGIGKSTLLYMMCGLMFPHKGSIRFDGIEVKRRLPETLEKIFLVPEEFDLPSISIDDYVRRNSVFYPNFNIDQFNQYLSDFELEHTKNLAKTSMGQKKKYLVSFALATNTPLLLMDEPTNHLDSSGRQRLYDWVEKCHSTLLVVSHDRTLLNLLPEICELEKHQLTYYGGNYEFYKEQKTLMQEALQQRIEEKEKALRIARKVARETAERRDKQNVRGEKANIKRGVPRIVLNALQGKSEKSTGKLNSVHQEKADKLTEERNQLRGSLSPTAALKTDFNGSSLHTGKTLITAKDINFGYHSAPNDSDSQSDNEPSENNLPEQLLWQTPVSFQLKSGDRLRIEGTNGSGKTTLLKIITGQLQPQTGTLTRADFSYVYLNQEYSIIDDRNSVLEQVYAFNNRNLPEHEIKIILNRYLFPASEWDKSCRKLSGGEKMRLAFCCLMISNNTPDMFILDEPTNNLDIQSIDIITATIRNYTGTVIAISHDNYFIREIGIEQRIVLS